MTYLFFNTKINKYNKKLWYNMLEINSVGGEVQMITVGWGNAEETMLVWRFDDHWTFKDIFRAAKRSRHMIRDTQSSAYLMVDMRQSRSWDSMMLLLSHAAATQRTFKPQRVVIISANPIYKQLWKTAQRMYGVVDYPVYFVKTVDDAYRFMGDVV